VALQIPDADVEGLGPSGGQQPPHPGAATGSQQRHALGGGEAVIKGLHPLVDPLPLVLPRPLKPLSVRLTRIGTQDLAAQPLDRLHPDPFGPA
jgi:hypothetical protein